MTTAASANGHARQSAARGNGKEHAHANSAMAANGIQTETIESSEHSSPVREH
jgi:hypothetical protein